MVALAAAGTSSAAGSQALAIHGAQDRTWDAAQLLERKDVATIKLDKDPFYPAAAPRYRALPLAALLPGITAGSSPPDTVVRFKALDGFVADIPIGDLTGESKGAPVPRLAIEDPAHPWPALPKGKSSAGPYALIWTGPGADKVFSERWPYQIAEISVVQVSPDQWPQLSIADVPAGSPIRRGQQVFIVQCMVCHQFSGAGSAHVGPDLGMPMSPIQYFGKAVLRRYLRDPASVRDWPARQMQGFDVHAMADADLDALIDFMAYKAPADTATR